MNDSNDSKPLSRRDLLRATTGLAMGAGLAKAGLADRGASVPNPWAEPTGTPKRVSANDKIVFGLIGCGGMGSANMQTLMQYPDVDVAAVCDVDKNRIPGDFDRVEKKYGRKPEVYEDYRKMLDRKDIDAVIIGTPDHWHALNLIHACEAGKDSYCEKPISHNIQEARAMVAAQKRFGRVVQVGTWQRSNSEFISAIDFVRSGKLGKVVLCRAWISDGTRLGKVQPSAVPSGFNYDMWIGPAAFVPYQNNKVHWNWRWVLNTGGGLTTDWGVHMLDIALLGMSPNNHDLVMPLEASAYGGMWAIKDDDRDAPDTIEAVLKFSNPDFVCTWAVGRDHPGKPGHCTEFVGADGRTVRVWRGGWQHLDPDGKELDKPEKPGAEPGHWREFLDCVKSRKAPRADLASVAKTTIVCHMVNASLFSGEPVEWDAAKMDVKGKAGRNTMAYTRPYRKGYSLRMY